jgi:hypothetical protein
MWPLISSLVRIRDDYFDDDGRPALPPGRGAVRAVTGWFDGEKNPTPGAIIDGDRSASFDGDETKVGEQIKVPKRVRGFQLLQALAYHCRYTCPPTGSQSATPVAECLKFVRLESEIHRLGFSLPNR